MKEIQNESLLYDNNYISWLVNYLNEKEFFSISRNNFLNKSSEIDNINSLKLPVFFSEIMEYANKNGYFPIKNKSGISYRLKIDDIGLEICLCYDNLDSFLYFLKTIPTDDFIDITLLKINAVDDKEKKILDLRKSVISLKDTGLSLKEINNITLETYKTYTKK